jgi:hypothetical protein
MMDALQLTGLCRDAATHLNLQDPTSLVEAGVVFIDGVQMAVALNERDTSALQLYANVGPVEEQHRMTTYENLLTSNLMMGGEHTGSFGMDPTSRQIAFTKRLDIDKDFDGAALARVLVQLSKSTREWRKTLLTGYIPGVIDALIAEIEDEGEGSALAHDLA